MRREIKRGLLIKSPWIEKILDGSKTWELRGSNCTVRGKIALIKSGSGQIVGYCDFKAVKGPLSLKELMKTTRLHRISKLELAKSGKPYMKTYAWIMEKPRKLKNPKKYKHKSGAIIWVRL